VERKTTTKTNCANKLCGKMKLCGSSENLKSSRGFRVYQHLLFKGIVCELSLIERKLSEFSKAEG
jgi:hypothetical protein